MYLGIDCGTQSLKTIVYSPDKGVVASAAQSYELIEGLAPGHKEQDPQLWIDALNQNMVEISASGCSFSEIKGIGVSGQQHGCVVLNKDCRVIRPAKLWCDTSTQKECEEIVANSKGQYFDEIGNGLPAGFTASKILWLKKNEPENYKKIAHILLPHDYINFYLTGLFTTEAGDASGTGYFNVRERKWSENALHWIDNSRDLKALLPRVIIAEEAAGELSWELAEKWQMPAGVKVSSGGGDNMMGAIGSGNVREGRATVSLGTSGTVFSYAGQPVIDTQQEIAAFCDSSGGWMPLGCTMNVTTSTELIRHGFMSSMALDDFNQQIAQVPPGSEGLLMLPYLEGERLPNLPDASGVLLGLREATAHHSYLARAAMEGVTFGLNYGLKRFKEMGLDVNQITLIGGGAKSAVWRQICADVFDAHISCPEIEEGPALGAALQAQWCVEGGDLAPVVDAAVCMNPEKSCAPIQKNVEIYQELFELSVTLSKALDQEKVFTKHRSFIENLKGDHHE